MVSKALFAKLKQILSIPKLATSAEGAAGVPFGVVNMIILGDFLLLLSGRSIVHWEPCRTGCRLDPRESAVRAV